MHFYTSRVEGCVLCSEVIFLIFPEALLFLQGTGHYANNILFSSNFFRLSKNWLSMDFYIFLFEATNFQVYVHSVVIEARGIRLPLFVNAFV